MNTMQRARVLEIRRLSNSTFTMKLARNNFKFIPGQCVNIGLVGSAVNREYSTYSGADDNYLEFLIRKVKGGAVSEGLSQLNPGQEVTLDGAYGTFIIKKPTTAGKYVFLGSGTGIAPFHSFVKSYPKIDFQILHGIRFATEQYDRKDYEKGSYIACVSKGKGGDFAGRVTDYLKKIPLPLDTLYYLCGNRAMINDVYDILRVKGINGSNIFTEVFF
ncbi:oxidoreductase [Candidatus Gottesmanbacteria bacterium]|nr:oxidoreductase [Candidatus Gottesmanbacteria bacterium]